MNKVIIIGRLTADPELRQSQNGTASCRFNVAVNRKFKNQNGEYDSDFISCVAFKQTAEFISRYFTKGKLIALEGTLRTGSYKDKKHQDVMHYTTDVFVENVEFCGDKGNNQNQPAPSAAQNVVQQAQAQGIDTSQYGNLSDFEEILSDGPTPF
jgi:single-strand DNA-binding protein